HQRTGWGRRARGLQAKPRPALTAARNPDGAVASGRKWCPFWAPTPPAAVPFPVPASCLCASFLLGEEKSLVEHPRLVTGLVFKTSGAARERRSGGSIPLLYRGGSAENDRGTDIAGPGGAAVGLSVRQQRTSARAVRASQPRAAGASEEVKSSTR